MADPQEARRKLREWLSFLGNRADDRIALQFIGTAESAHGKPSVSYGDLRALAAEPAPVAVAQTGLTDEAESVARDIAAMEGILSDEFITQAIALIRAQSAEIAVLRADRDSALDEITEIEKEIGFDGCKAMVNFLATGKLPDPATDSRSAFIAALRARAEEAEAKLAKMPSREAVEDAFNALAKHWHLSLPSKPVLDDLFGDTP